MAALAIISAAAFAQGGPRAVLRGFVLADSTEQPLGGAEVAIASLSVRSRTEAHGAFRLGGLPAGTYLVTVRMLGYQPLGANLRVAPGDSLERDFLLVRAPTRLGPVNVAETARRVGNPKLATFDDHRSRGIGHFLTSATLDSMGHRRLGEIIAGQIAGAQVVNESSSSYVATRRPSDSFAAGRRPLPGGNLRRKPRDLCYSKVYLDGAVVYGGREGETRFDVNVLQPSQVMGIEYYAGIAQVPVEFEDPGNRCGVLVIWTR